MPQDAGAEYHYYTSDVTRTWPVNGRFSPAHAIAHSLDLGRVCAANVPRAGLPFPTVLRGEVARSRGGVCPAQRVVYEAVLDVNQQVIAAHSRKRTTKGANRVLCRDWPPQRVDGDFTAHRWPRGA